jgi:diacylglycerol kinase family enzyme
MVRLKLVEGHSPARTATVIVNERARGVRPGFDPRRLVRYLERRDLAVDLALPASAAETRTAAWRAAEDAHDLAFVLGGDGTLRDAAEGLLRSPTALAALPGGTVNVWCREAGIPLRLRGAVDAHLSGVRAPCDVGCAGDRLFLLMASLGWDAAVVRDVSPGLKRCLGDAAYGVRALAMAPRFRTSRASWRAGPRSAGGPLAVMVLSNTRLYGGRWRPNPEALACDGLLDVLALCPRGPLEATRLAARFALSRLPPGPAVLRDRVAEVEVTTPGLPVQVDGDYLGETPMRFTVEPGGLLVSVPRVPPVLGG